MSEVTAEDGWRYDFDDLYHEALGWSDAELHLRLGELSLNYTQVEPISGERLAVEKEIDCLTFELACREGGVLLHG